MQGYEAWEGPVLQKVIIDRNNLEDFEIGARLDALLAFPQERETRRRSNIETALCAEIIQLSISDEPLREKEYRKRYSRYAKRRNRTSLKALDERRHIYKFAGVAVLPYLKEPMLGLPFIPPVKDMGLSQRNIAKYICQMKDGEPDLDYIARIEDFEKRTIRKWRPIWHLVAAHQYIARQRDGGPFPIDDVDTWRLIVGIAKKFAPALVQHPQLKVTADDLLDIEWIERCTDSCP